LSETALLAVALAAAAGVVAGRAWTRAQRRESLERAARRSSPHYARGLHHLAAGQLDLAISELAKVARHEPDAPEVPLVLGSLLREAGQTERAIQVHQELLSRPDLTREERVQARTALGIDYRKAGFLDRATRTFEEVLADEPRSFQALAELERLCAEQRQWRRVYELRARLGRARKTDESRVLGHLQATIGREQLEAGDRDGAERSFRAALGLDRRVFPAYLGLADLAAPDDPRRAAAIVEEAVQLSPERAYLAFGRLRTCYARSGQPERFEELCERMIRQDPRDWRARLALAGHLRAQGRDEEAAGLALRALGLNPHAHATHLEVCRTVRAGADIAAGLDAYLATAEGSLFYRDPHICTRCRYRADDMLWRCPHCHEWDTFVEERVGAAPTT
jgi:lipopolysaccharide biosynthesis regulator YciM